MSAYEFKVGDVVELLPGNYQDEPWNPLNKEGVITEKLERPGHCIIVQWETGHKNSYNPFDLNLLHSATVSNTGPTDLSDLYEKLGHERYFTRHHTIRRAHRVSSISGTKHIIIEEGSRSISINPKELPNVVAALAEFL